MYYGIGGTILTIILIIIGLRVLGLI